MEMKEYGCSPKFGKGANYLAYIELQDLGVGVLTVPVLMHFILIMYSYYIATSCIYIYGQIIVALVINFFLNMFALCKISL